MFPALKRLESDHLGSRTGKKEVEFGVKTCFIVEEAPWAKPNLGPSVG